MKKVLLSSIFILIFVAILIFTISKRDIQALKLTAIPLSQTAIKLKWNGNHGNFILYRRLTKTGRFIKIGETTSTLYIDKNLTANTTYYYRIKEKNKSGHFEVSNIASTTTFEQIPKAPVLSITSSNQSAFLSWKENSGVSLNGFVLYKRRSGIAKFTPIATLTYSETRYVDNNLKPNMEYFYEVRAYNNRGFSKCSNVVNIKTSYTVAGSVIGTYGKSIPDVVISFDSSNNKYEFVKSALNGQWIKKGLKGIVKIRAYKNKWKFIPEKVIVRGGKNIIFYGINASKKEGTLRWKFKTEGGIVGSVAIGLNGTIYAKSQDNYLYAINPNGTLKWKFKTGLWVSVDPAVSSNGTVYAVSHHGYLLAINSNGKLKWKFETGSNIESSPAIDSNGIIYVGSGAYLYAIKTDGELRWKFDTGSKIESSPAIDSNGTIYIGSGVYFYAIKPNGKLKWKFETGSKIESSPAINSNGTVYFSSNDDYFYSVSQDGKLKWKFKIGWSVLSSPAISLDGTIYVGSDDGYLYAIRPNGKLKWKFERGHFPIYNPSIGSNGVIYVGKGKYLLALNPNGTLRWKYKTGGCVSGPTIGLRTVYIGAGDDNLYAIASNSNGLSNSAWPIFQHDCRHTGNKNYLSNK